MADRGSSPSGLAALLAPRSIALVGASARASSVSFTQRFTETNRNLGYAGQIHFINPNRAEIFGEPCWPNVASLPSAPDVVVINLPDERVLPAVRDAIDHGARALMIHSGGFTERGASGALRQQEVQRLCREAGVVALGPNCLGILNLVGRVSVSSFRMPKGVAAGSIAAISQSGSVASILHKIAGRHGVSFMASTGNEAVTTAEDLIGYAIDDPATRLIVCFIEALRRPRDLFDLAARARSAGKPIIVLKVGLTTQGANVSRGHTGALAGSGAVYRQAFEQAGVIRVEDFDELAQTVELFANLRAMPTRCQVGLLGTSGGELGSVADLATEAGLTMPVPRAHTLADLQKVLYLPDELVPQNPLDVGTGFVSPLPYQQRMGGALAAMAADDGMDVLAVVQGFYRDSEDLQYSLNHEMMLAAVHAAGTQPKPVVVISSRAGATDPEVMAEVWQAGVPALEGLREGLRALRHLERYITFRDEPSARSATPPPALPPGASVSQATLFPLLAAAGIATTPVTAVSSAEAARAAVAGLAGRAVMKIDTARVVHKSDIGGVALGVTEADAAASYARLAASLDPPVGSVAGEAIVVAPMLEDGVEFYIGATWDESFGPVVVCGMGGRFLEILGRTALLVAPFSQAAARSAIARSGAESFLSGFRGGPSADLDALAAMLVRVGQFAMSLGGRLAELDLNPVIVTRDQPGGCVADARLLLQPELPT